MTAPNHDQPVAIITGASAGIGLAIARTLAGAGHALVMTARSEDRLFDAAQSVTNETGAPVLPVVVDAGSPTDMEHLVSATVEQFGRLDVLVNNAGAANALSIEDSDSAEFLETYIVNVFGPAAAIRAAWPHFKDAHRGTIINISSWAVRDPFPGFYIYASSKGALNALTRVINNAGAEHHIRAFSVCPAAVETALLRSVADESAVPPDMCLDPNDIAEVVLGCINGEYDNAPNADIYVRRTEDGSVQIDIPADIPR